jgi:hypothetical protein
MKGNALITVSTDSGVIGCLVSGIDPPLLAPFKALFTIKVEHGLPNPSKIT